MALIEKVCLENGKEPPLVVAFRRQPHAKAEHSHGRGTIYLPSQSYAREYQIVDGRPRYRLLVLHETAHHIMGPDMGHSAAYYMLLFQLCERYGVDLEFAHDDEVAYKPRGAKKGWAMFQALN